MTISINRKLGFAIEMKKEPDQPFIVLTLTLRCACCGSMKPSHMTTIGVN
jgi:hypothetical protein